MTNSIVIGNPWHEFITDANNFVDEHIMDDRKGQYYGHKIYTVTEDSDPDLPEEYVGSWKCPMMWGEMCGEMDKKDLVRVTPREETVVVIKWDVV